MFYHVLVPSSIPATIPSSDATAHLPPSQADWVLTLGLFQNLMIMSYYYGLCRNQASTKPFFALL
jgi:hypothetical protein